MKGSVAKNSIAFPICRCISALILAKSLFNVVTALCGSLLTEIESSMKGATLSPNNSSVSNPDAI